MGLWFVVGSCISLFKMQVFNVENSFFWFSENVENFLFCKSKYKNVAKSPSTVFTLHDLGRHRPKPNVSENYLGIF